MLEPPLQNSSRLDSRPFCSQQAACLNSLQLWLSRSAPAGTRWLEHPQAATTTGAPAVGAQLCLAKAGPLLIGQAAVQLEQPDSRPSARWTCAETRPAAKARAHQLRCGVWPAATCLTAPRAGHASVTLAYLCEAHAGPTELMLEQLPLRSLAALAATCRALRDVVGR